MEPADYPAQGGSYVVVNGVRVPADPVTGEPIAEKPAPAADSAETEHTAH